MQLEGREKRGWDCRKQEQICLKNKSFGLVSQAEVVLGAFTSPAHQGEFHWRHRAAACAQPATMDAPTLSEVPQTRKPCTKLCLAFRSLTLVLSHRSNAPQLAEDSYKKKKAAPGKSSLVSREIWGITGEPPLAPARLGGMEAPHSSQRPCKAPQPSRFSFHGKSSAHIWRSLQDDDDNVFLLNKIHF